MWCHLGEIEISLGELRAMARPIDGGAEAFEVQKIGPCDGCRRRSWKGQDHFSEIIAILVTRKLNTGDEVGIAPNITACNIVNDDGDENMND